MNVVDDIETTFFDINTRSEKNVSHDIMGFHVVQERDSYFSIRFPDSLRFFLFTCILLFVFIARCTSNVACGKISCGTLFQPSCSCESAKRHTPTQLHVTRKKGGSKKKKLKNIVGSVGYEDAVKNSCIFG